MQTNNIKTYAAVFIFSCLVALIVGEGVARVLLPPPQVVTVQPASDLIERRQLELSQHLVLDIPNHPEQAKHHFYRMTLAGRRMRANTTAIVENHSMSGRRIEIKTNSLGYRNREIERNKKRRFLFLGDSITLGAYLPENETFVRLIEEKAGSEGRNWETINSGVSGISLKTELAILHETGLGLEPDVVVLGFYLNDFQESPGVYVQQMPWIARNSHLFYYLLQRFYIEVPDLRAAAQKGDADLIAKGDNFRVSMPKDLWRIYELAGERVDKWRGEFDGQRKTSKGEARAFYERVSSSFDDWGGVWSPYAWDYMKPLFGELSRLSDERDFEVVVVCFPVLDQVVTEQVYDVPQQQLRKLSGEMGWAYLMPLNVAFSIWFFFIIGMIERLLFARIGLIIGGGSDIWTSGGGHLAISHQMAGGFAALSIFVLWTARPHLIRLWRLAKEGRNDEREVLSPRTAFAGLIFGLIFMVTWLTVTGMSFYVSLLVVLGAIIVFVGLSRIVCEAGIPGAQMPMAPQSFVTRGFGPETLGLGNMTALGYSTVWLGETAANMMNAVVHSLKLTSTEGRASRRLPWAIFLSIIVGLAGSIWITMNMAYTYGGINLNDWYYNGAPRWPFRYMASVYNLPEADVGTRFAFTGGGALFMGALLFLRQRFLWWPLHPIGFPIANTYTIVSYGWLAIFMAWMFKAIILRYGGVRLYRMMIPFFLGLTLGEFATAVLWTFIDGYFGVQGNRIFNF